VQRSFDTGAVVVSKDANAVDDVLKVLPGDVALGKVKLGILKARLRPTTQIQDNLDQRPTIASRELITDRGGHVAGKRKQYLLQVVYHGPVRLLRRRKF
jgi:hypothetical protein